MTLILSGTDGLSDIDGSAATPAIRGTDANTGIFFPAADTIAFSEGGVESVRIDASGNVGIGTSSPATKLDVSGQGKLNAITFSFNTSYYNTDNSISNYSAGNYMYVSGNSTGGTGGLYLQGAGNQKQAIIVDGISTGGNIAFQTNGSERARIDSTGVVYLGLSSAFPSGNVFQYSPTSSNAAICHSSAISSGTNYIGFLYNGSTIGSITQNGTTGVLYNLTSDYRLKNNPQALTGAKDFVMALQPKKWQWWDGSGEGVGFIAHEFMEVAKYSGNGVKDAVDADGKPVHQSIQPSSSEVMANLVAFIQEQQALIVSMRNELDALKTKVGA